MNMRTVWLLTAIISLPALARETDDPLDTPPSVPAPEKPVAAKPEPAAGSRMPTSEAPAANRDVAPTASSAPHNAPTALPAPAKAVKPGQPPVPNPAKPVNIAPAPKPVDAKPSRPGAPVKPTDAAGAANPPHASATPAAKPAEKNPTPKTVTPPAAQGVAPPTPTPPVAATPLPGASSPDAKGNIVLSAAESPEQRRQQALLANAERLDRINQELLTRNTALQQQAETATLKARVLEDDRSAEGVRNGALAVISGFLLGWFFRGLRGSDRRSW